mmetsp:Transcript_21161/g.23948  ORF Transcript_21161/g.23948 Transcript_21161/m.23948 type:complete len:119 (+) Transcript_21161:35-391(+)|eukprot:CAMPEP_0115006174 /NCGR_PEP_ID=MMETSP0216-20121206/20330_1 /TAXON_ID=223996 /ORGANISM="Protocruzia adherens, Strain Boccale" /LENGTH=118 /DNA_ID=CAMNT_0002372681 /DNA_START=36 /DNA_END=392 /DNA_ORIENTATION=-
MDDYASNEELAYNQDEVEKLVLENVEACLGGLTYEEERVPQWINNISERIMKALNDLQKPFKYVITCMIMQKNGSAFYSATACFYDNYDGCTSVQWPKDRESPNKTMTCVVTVFSVGF